LCALNNATQCVFNSCLNELFNGIFFIFISCLCKELYSKTHFHFLPLLSKVVCANTSSVAASSLILFLMHFFLFFFVNFVAFYTSFLWGWFLNWLLWYCFSVCFAFLVSLCTFAVKMSCYYTTCKTFYIFFFANYMLSWFNKLFIKTNFCYFPLLLSYISLIKRRRKYE
jgi:hypothetical protein